MYFFGLGNGRISGEEATRIKEAISATEIDAEFIRIKSEKRFFFRLNLQLGAPHDERRAQRIEEAVGQIRCY